jgi:tetratricopeptide (TPR) repeat protein
MLGVADALGVTCGHCHPGGDNETWDSTNFTGDVKPTKKVAREMFRLVDRLNRELLPAALKPGEFAVPVTCMTCHRGALRPVMIEDTLAIILDRQGVDSAIAAHRRIRERYRGRMTYDLSDWPLRLLASRSVAQGRHRDAVKILEEDARLFPDSGELAYELGAAYESDGERQLAIMQYHKVLSMLADHKPAQRRLRALTVEPPK